jgi:uncharacterized RDD family membrane protein YckC
MVTAEGWYYRRDDYASFRRRLAVDLVDLAVIGFACAAAPALWVLVGPAGWSADPALAACCALVYAYFVPLKRSRFRTLGYRVGGVKVVGFDGRPAAWGALALRLGFAMLGPINWLIDLGWLSGDRHRQALRDTLAGCYVIRADAQPAGAGRLVHRYAEACGYNFLYREVEPPE